VGFIPGKGADPEKIEEQEAFRKQKPVKGPSFL
jgi:hypothetical protein